MTVLKDEAGWMVLIVRSAEEGRKAVRPSSSTSTWSCRRYDPQERRSGPTRPYRGPIGPCRGRGAILPYKATIDALGWLHDTGAVVRFGRKFRAAWALSGSPAALQLDPMGALEVLWRGQASIPAPPPTGGGRSYTPVSCCLIGPTLKIFLEYV